MSLRRVEVATAPPYSVHIGRGAVGAVASEALGRDRVAVVADQHVLELHGDALGGLPDAARIRVPRGEAAKTLSQLGVVLDALVEAGLSRSSLVVSFGGGATCDLAGLAASLYKRGCDVVHVPTTLLAQVDASVGGKTAVNLRAGKNLAGTFHQPAAVYADTALLATLDADELRSGLGEVVKTAVLSGEEDLAHLERSAAALTSRDADALADVVERAVWTKARVVAEDPEERGSRRALNLGHTFAHAIERTAGYGQVPHGVAVAAGLGLALDAARQASLLEDEGLAQRVSGLLRALGLPAGLAELRASSAQALNGSQLLAALAHDKKGRVGAPEFVLPTRAGHCVLGVELDTSLLERLLA